MEDLVYLTYKSIFNQSKYTPMDFSKIVGTSRQHNKDKSITGILIFDGVNIFQYIEGSSNEIASLYQRICLDERHYEIKLLTKGVINSRKFVEWDMGYYYSSNGEPSLDELLDENMQIDDLLQFVQQIDLV